MTPGPRLVCSKSALRPRPAAISPCRRIDLHLRFWPLTPKATRSQSRFSECCEATRGCGLETYRAEPFKTEDGETILMHYTGLVEQTEAFKKAAEANKPTGWEDQYMRLMIRFDAGAEQYRWLTQSLFIAKGRLVGTGQIEYAVSRVT